MVAGDKLEPDLPFPGVVLSNISYHVNSSQKISFSPGEVVPVADKPGKFYMQVRLFGLIPIHEMVVNVMPRVEVIPGGQSIGVLMHASGVMVVGTADVSLESGESVNPAAQAGIKAGDIILQAGGEEVNSEVQLQEIINYAGNNRGKIDLKIRRHDKILTRTLEPVYCRDTNSYRIGLFIRDSAAGVGTLTFYHPQSKSYGALGHMISDLGTSRKADLEDGCIVGAQVQGITPGKRGQPGEKIGFFEGNSKIKGNIIKNTRYGIFGRLEKPLENPFFKKPVPVALSDEVREGPATILTVLNGESVKKYDIQIQQVMPQSRDGKGLIIKITDPELLKCTGGIIQGMSGSPIIQNNKLVGAVTHVFINNPQRGYGVLAQWMIQQTDIIAREPAQNAS